MTLPELRDQYRDLVTRLKEMQRVADDDNRDFNAEENDNWNKLNDDLNRCESNIARMQRIADAESRMGESSTIPPSLRRNVNDDPNLSVTVNPDRPREMSAAMVRDTAIEGWMRHAMNRHVTDEHRQAARRAGFTLGHREIEIPLPKNFEAVKRQVQSRQLGTDPTSGGITDDMSTLIPTGFVYELERTRLWYGGMLDAAGVFRTDSGNPLHWPTSDDTDNEAEVVQEGQELVPPDAYATYGEVIFGAHKFSSRMVLASTEAHEDAGFDMSSMIARDLGERLGRGINKSTTTGSGSGEPEGITTSAVRFQSSLAAQPWGADTVIDLAHSVDIAYRQPGVARYMLHDDVLKAVRKLKTDDGWYIWQPAPLMGLQQGLTSTIYGFGYVVNNHMPTIAGVEPVANETPMIFGELSKFKIREVRGMRLRVLVERYGELDLVGYIAFQRVDSKSIQPNAYRLLEIIA